MQTKTKKGRLIYIPAGFAIDRKEVLRSTGCGLEVLTKTLKQPQRFHETLILSVVELGQPSLRNAHRISGKGFRSGSGCQCRTQTK
jgi:hypothetical protein